MTCVYFFKVFSENVSLRNYLTNNSSPETLVSSLLLEELYMKNYPIPIDIENTSIGRSCEYLLSCTRGPNALSGRSLPSYRVLARIADLLMGVQDPSNEILTGKDYIEKLREIGSKDFLRKLQFEIGIWEDQYNELSNSLFLEVNVREKL